MKKSLNYIIKPMLLLVLIAFTGCEKDLYEDGLQNGSRTITIKQISINDLDKTISSRINEKIALVKKMNENESTVENRFEYDSSLGMYIDTENGKLIDNNGELSYTFPMFRDSEEHLENIIFKPISNGEIETYISKYNVKPEEFVDLTYQEIATLEPELQKMSANGWYIVCIESQTQTGVTPIDNGDLTGNFGYEPVWETTGTTCYFIDNSGSSPMDFPIITSNGTTGNNGGGTTSTGVSTSPTGISPNDLFVKDFIRSLTDEQEDLYIQQPEEVQNSINTFLINNSFSLESKDLLTEVLQTSIQNNIPVIKLFRIINEMTKPCQAKIIFNSLLKVNSDFNQLIKDNLIIPTDRNIFYNNLPSSEMPSSTVGAFTIKEPFYLAAPDTGYAIGITFNNNYLNTATDLGIVIMSYHELLHAYFIDLFHQGNLLVQYPTYTELNDAFTNYYLNSNAGTATALDNQLHDVFVDFIDIIAQSILNYCQINGIEEVNLDYAKKLVWGSLYGTPTFTENLTETQQLEAQTLIAYENYNYPSAKGTKTCN